MFVDSCERERDIGTQIMNDHVIELITYPQHVIAVGVPWFPTMMMNLVKKDLFGGAIIADFPEAFFDASYVIDRELKAWHHSDHLDLA
jgi:hypothetical protein